MQCLLSFSIIAPRAANGNKGPCPFKRSIISEAAGHAGYIRVVCCRVCGVRPLAMQRGGESVKYVGKGGREGGDAKRRWHRQLEEGEKYRAAWCRAANGASVGRAGERAGGRAASVSGGGWRAFCHAHTTRAPREELEKEEEEGSHWRTDGL